MKAWQFGVTTALGVAALGLVTTEVVLASGNRTLQAEINQRQQYLQQSVQLEGLYREMVRALAERAASSGDDALRDLLAHNGIRYSVDVPAPAPAAALPDVPARKPTR
ncbi:MAG: hypothetical protein ABIN96_13045 [Rubrivivax sp.]